MELRLFIAAFLLAGRCVVAAMPEEGDSSPRFEKFDRTIRDFASSNAIFAVTTAAGERGQIIHLRSLGYADREKTKPLPISARFRIASVTKPVTAAAVKSLIRDGKLKPETHLADVLKSPPWPVPKDERRRDITIEDLLTHRGGWDRDSFGDPMFMHARIFKDTGHAPAVPADVIRWMFGQPLQFAPGEKDAYSNFGYCLLGRVIETTARKDYFPFVQETIAKPCGITSWALARSAANPQKDEVWYDFNSERGEYFRIGLMDSHGGLVSTASDLCRFMAKYWLNGAPRSGRGRFYFYGSLPGTTAIAVQRSDGLDYAILLNKRSTADDVKWHELLRAQVDAVLDGEN